MLSAENTGPFDARSLVVPTTVSHTHASNATEADAQAAGHGGFQRHPAGYLVSFGDTGHRFHHGLRTATLDACLSTVCRQQLVEHLGDESVMSLTAVIGSNPHVHAKLLEILDTRKVFGRSRPVAQRHARWLTSGPMAIAVGLVAQQLFGQSQEGRLADASGDKYDVSRGLPTKSISQRAP